MPDSKPKTTRQPPWTRDEILIALDLYLRHNGKVCNSTDTEVIAISKFLQLLPIYPDRTGDDFRSPNSVSLKLANFRRLGGGASKGLAHGNQLEEQVWAEYSKRPEELRLIVQQISKAASRDMLPDSEEEFEDIAIEGRLLFRVHRRRERQPELARRKRVSVVKTHGRLVCEACDADGSRYGSLGEAVFEVHHLVPLADSGETVTGLPDLALLCANCHRAIHRSATWLSLSGLRGLIHS